VRAGRTVKRVVGAAAGEEQRCGVVGVVVVESALRSECIFYI